MAEKIVLNVPTTEEKVRALKIGSEVYVTGTIFNLFSGTINQLVQQHKAGEEIPEGVRAGLKDGAISHSGPLVKDWKILANGSLNVRAVPLSTWETLVKDFGVRIIIAKDEIDVGAIELLKEYGAAYLCTVVGAGIWYSYPRIKRIKNIYWEELGMGHACYELEAENFGPVWVGTDAHGNSLFEDVKKRLEENRKKIYRKQGWTIPK